MGAPLDTLGLSPRVTSYSRTVSCEKEMLRLAAAAAGTAGGVLWSDAAAAAAAAAAAVSLASPSIAVNVDAGGANANGEDGTRTPNSSFLRCDNPSDE